MDPSQFERILLNLAVNAQDAMPGGGRLIFATENVDVDHSLAARLAPMTAGRYVRLSVSDTGTGIPLEIQPRIFEPFFTTKGRGRGTGLGLATAYGFIKQSGGFIWVSSEPGRGTTFDIYLPGVSEAVEAPTIAPVETPAGGSETILLAEDDAAVRRLAAEILRRWGYTVLEARDGEEALALALSGNASIHLLITDMVMPGLSGRALAAKLAEHRPFIRVLYTSGYVGDAISGAQTEGGASFLPKPFLLLDLVRAVRDVLDAPPSITTPWDSSQGERR